MIDDGTSPAARASNDVRGSNADDDTTPIEHTRAGANRLAPLVRPHALLVLGVVPSLVAWAIPWTDDVVLRFRPTQSLTLGGGLLLGAWYGLVFAAAYLGFRLGARIEPRRRLDATRAETYYRYLTLAALLGVTYSYLSVELEHPGLIEAALRNREFNAVRSVLPYEAGPQTLRYAAILSGGLAIYRIARRRRPGLLDGLNVVLLLLNSAVAARSALVMAFVVALGAYVHEHPNKRLSLRRLTGYALLGAVAGFVLLTPLTYIRAASGYERGYGTENPLVINTLEINAYLAAPFEGSVATANHARALGLLPTERLDEGLLTFVVPTWVPVSVPHHAYLNQFRYNRFAKIEPSLSTNSVFANAFSSMGLYAFAVFAALAFGAALLAGHASRYRSSFYLAVYVIGYCFAEFWRVHIFNAGFVHFLLLLLLAIPPAHWMLMRSLAPFRTRRA